MWDEWVPGEGALAGALGVATVLNEMFRHTGLFTMSAYTCAPCALTYDGTDAAFGADGLVFKLYSSRFGDVPVQVRGESPQQEVQGTVGVDKALEPSGSDTRSLDVMAALSTDRGTPTISVVNATGSEQVLDLAVMGTDLAGPTQKWTLTGPSLEVRNEPGEAPQSTVEERPDVPLGSPVNIEPLTVNLFKVTLEQ